MAVTGMCVPGDALAAAMAVKADLTVVGPEVPLVAGIVDQFRAQGLRIVGPAAAAAQLEGSKIFAKNFLKKSGIPTADYVTVEDATQARMALGRFRFPVVLKADGLAAGKGVIIAHDASEAEAALATLTGPLVIEEFLVGEEVSFIALCDGRDVVPLAPTQDHKAVFDGDQGPNTGGMGAYCDGAILTEAQTREVMDRVIYPTVEATGFTGFLYAGLMMTADGVKVLEFNVRLGDPETQPLMHRMASDFAPVLMAAAEGRLGGTKIEWKPGPSVCVVMAMFGIRVRTRPRSDHRHSRAETTGATVFHAGTRHLHGRLETVGRAGAWSDGIGAGPRAAIACAMPALERNSL
jgi:phosphoribosylamine--glycine ligase